MNLVVDIGNTTVKVAQFEVSECLEVNKFTNRNDFLEFCSGIHFENSIISSVKEKSYTDEVMRQFENGFLLDYTTALPITNNYASPSTLGNDRIANVVGANALFPNQNNLVVDVGTCLKFDLINNMSVYLGGSISLGLKMRFKALHTLTDNLPLIEDVEINQLIGNDTTSSIQIGVYQGMIAEMSKMISQYERKYDQLNIILTGGDLDYFSDVDLSQKNSIFADDLLTLKGLNTILNYNVQK